MYINFDQNKKNLQMLKKSIILMRMEVKEKNLCTKLYFPHQENFLS
jgi:hypothetical protein